MTAFYGNPLLLLALALLVSDTAAGLASGLARGLAFAAATVLNGFHNVLSFNGFNSVHDLFLHKKMPPLGGILSCNYLLSFLFSQAWFAIPQLVLQADWQEVWHSPQPPFLALSQRLRVPMVLICSIMKILRDR